jgi:molybdopterin-guanine dinucleotide biosynthesis protein B|tara:strand:+ start:2210 stop:2761 length:552 start_codon:yes stop_codon:yes gene_type:complete
LSKILAIIGTSNTGKTSIIEYLVTNLVKKGLTIGSAKHVHHPDFSIDLDGKDTWRHANAGSKRVVCLSEDEVAIIRKEKGPEYKLEDILKLFQDEEFDLIILEGFHWMVSSRKEVLKIVTAKDVEDAEKRLNGTIPPILAITGKISNILRGKSIQKIPIIDLKDESDQLLDLIMEQVLPTAGN